MAVITFGLGLALLLGGGTGWAHENHHHEKCPEQIVEERPKGVDSGSCRIPEAELLSVEGKHVCFYEDLVKSKTVVISFVYTDCRLFCSLISANVAALQDALGSRAGQDVQLISVTIDPVFDTPAVLQEWSQHFEPGPGWVFLTGEKHRVNQLLKGLKVFAPPTQGQKDKFADHPQIMIVANDRTGYCHYTNGLPTPKQLLQIIDRLADEVPEDARESE